ncbi:YdcF family protein [Acetobacter cibinongensis]|uniref:YdcF family protein n=1 Tax=Acetobacter cibinongensis TaxID=146475 RepID=UPI000A36B138|nr:YdcF family protein [Acetobacter cibinongensis]
MIDFESVLTTQPDIDAVNTIAGFLAGNNEVSIPQKQDVDLVIHAGNAVLQTAESACNAARNSNCQLLFSGGVGHSTTLLVETVKENGLLKADTLDGLSEAEILGQIATKIWAFPKENLLLETQSTNCGENAVFSRSFLEKNAIAPESVLLFQDPTMQLRTLVTFDKAWASSNWNTRFYNCPSFVPRLAWQGRRITYAPGLPSGLWSPKRFLSLILGEIPRLRDDERGYGPRGMNFIPHVDIPHEVEAAYGHIRGLLHNDAQIGVR